MLHRQPPRAPALGDQFCATLVAAVLTTALPASPAFADTLHVPADLRLACGGDVTIAGKLGGGAGRRSTGKCPFNDDNYDSQASTRLFVTQNTYWREGTRRPGIGI